MRESREEGCRYGERTDRDRIALGGIGYSKGKEGTLESNPSFKADFLRHSLLLTIMHLFQVRFYSSSRGR